MVLTYNSTEERTNKETGEIFFHHYLTFTREINMFNQDKNALFLNYNSQRDWDETLPPSWEMSVEDLEAQFEIREREYTDKDGVKKKSYWLYDK